MSVAVVSSLLVASLVVLAIIGQRAAYRGGACDGWCAAKYPRDPLWNGVREMLRKYGLTDRTEP